MGEMAIFTKEVAEGLVARGFRITGYTDKAWFFEDSVALERAVNELIAGL